MIPIMAQTAAEMMEAAGAKNVFPFQVPNRVPGYGIHEMGTARMGGDPKTSVLNGFCQSHDIKNLFVTDASRVRVERVPKPDAHDHGAHRPRLRLSDAGDEGRKRLKMTNDE